MIFSLIENPIETDYFDNIKSDLNKIFRDTLFYQYNPGGNDILDVTFGTDFFKNISLEPTDAFFLELYMIEPGDTLPILHTDNKITWIRERKDPGWGPYSMNYKEFLNGGEDLIPVQRKKTGILYFTESELGGTSLYDEGKKLITIIRPKYNRFLLFEVDENSWHKPEPSEESQCRIVFWVSERI